MSKQVRLSVVNKSMLSVVKRAKQGISTTAAGLKEGLSANGAVHHLKRLKRAGLVTRDRKTLNWSAR